MARNWKVSDTIFERHGSVILTFLMYDWRIGCPGIGGPGMIVRTGCIGLCSSSVLRRLASPVDWTLLGLETAGRWLLSSFMTLLGGFAGLGTGGLMRACGCIEPPNREGGREDPRSLR